VTGDPDTRAVLAVSALFRQQCPKNLRTEWRVCAGSNGWDDTLAEVVKGLPEQRVIAQNGANGHGEHCTS